MSDHEEQNDVMNNDAEMADAQQADAELQPIDAQTVEDAGADAPSPKKHKYPPKPPSPGQLYITDLQKRLNEPAKHIRGKFWRLIEKRGQEFVEHYVTEAIRLEETGGLMTLDGSRRRTVGGIFFRLIKEQLTEAEWRYISPMPNQVAKKKKKEWEKKQKEKEGAAAEKAEKQQKQAKPQKQAGEKQAKPPKQPKQPPAPSYQPDEGLLTAQLPAGAPAVAKAKLKGLQTAAGLYHRKLAELSKNPKAGGYEMTKRTLENTEQQIRALLAENS